MALAVIDTEGLAGLFEVLQARGYETVGPTARDGAIVYAPLASAAELPVGWTDRHGPGFYRLERRDDHAYFGYVVGPQSWKQYLFPPHQTLFRARRSESEGFTLSPEPVGGHRYAFIGVRACELRAIAVQDKVFLQGPYADSAYRARREQLFLVAVNCSQAGATCFCVSMGSGPEVTAGFDLALTEVLDDQRHYFTVEAGSTAGAEVLAELPRRAASTAEAAAARAVPERAARQMGRKLDTTGIRDLLLRNLEHPRWDQVAERCLSCANCTLVCPTCFCSALEDRTDLMGQEAVRERRWDSCYNADFSHLGSGSVRQTTRSRYRQWLTHKLGSWHDQFGESGCVGCGRCISWCPVGIDLTEEVAAIRAADGERSDP